MSAGKISPKREALTYRAAFAAAWSRFVRDNFDSPGACRDGVRGRRIDGAEVVGRAARPGWVRRGAGVRALSASCRGADGPEMRRVLRGLATAETIIAVHLVALGNLWAASAARRLGKLSARMRE
jgi:hypothetical protein